MNIEKEITEKVKHEMLHSEYTLKIKWLSLKIYS